MALRAIFLSCKESEFKHSFWFGKSSKCGFKSKRTRLIRRDLRHSSWSVLCLIQRLFWKHWPLGRNTPSMERHSIAAHYAHTFTTFGCTVDSRQVSGMRKKTSEPRGSEKLCKETRLGLNPGPVNCAAPMLLYHETQKMHGFTKVVQKYFELFLVKNKKN